MLVFHLRCMQTFPLYESVFQISRDDNSNKEEMEERYTNCVRIHLRIELPCQIHTDLMSEIVKFIS